jgi:hypothetical protein
MEERYCPHCEEKLQNWVAPPDTGWGEILVCFNNECPHYAGSPDEIENKGDANRALGCRYAENPDNNYRSFNLLAVCL